MTENAKTQKPSTVQSGEVALMIDGLYNYLARDLKKLKTELSNELKYASLQTSSVYETMKKDASETAAATEQAAASTVRELRYTYQQNQAIYSELSRILSEDVVSKLDTVEGKLALIESIDEALAKLNEKFASFNAEEIAETIKDKVIECFPAYDEVDYEKITESVAERTEASVSEHSRQVLEAVAAIPVAENVDYTRIVEEVGDRVLEIAHDLQAAQPAAEEIDYDRVVYETAEKVVESLPPVEKLDYTRIEEAITKIVSEEVAKAVASIDADEIAEAIASKIVVPAPQVEAFDYDRLAILMMAKMPVPQELDYEKLADMVAERMKAEEETQEVIVDDEGVAKIAAQIAEKVKEEKQNIVIEEEGVQAIATAIAEKLAVEEPKEEEDVTYEMLIDDSGVEAIAEAVAKKLCENCCTCEQPVEETATEEPALVEEVQEETVEETATEEPAPVEEVKEEPAQEELAASAAETVVAEVSGEELVDAETGLVIRLKKSFTAKMKQSEDGVKGYYSEIKNALTGYKKINSNVSWHGDRFNFGRDTVARINIVGKTLGLYLALDPEDPEFKTTVYHQKNVGNQKAYENTPFMVKIKSAAALKKALRLVEALATKLGAEKQKNFKATDYVAEYAFATTKELLDEGLIKATKEKKVVLDF